MWGRVKRSDKSDNTYTLPVFISDYSDTLVGVICGPSLFRSCLLSFKFLSIFLSFHNFFIFSLVCLFLYCLPTPSASIFVSFCCCCSSIWSHFSICLSSSPSISSSVPSKLQSWNWKWDQDRKWQRGNDERKCKGQKVYREINQSAFCPHWIISLIIISVKLLLI